MKDVFINEAINQGIISYISKESADRYNINSDFESTIIEILVSIYGEINIINPFKIKDAKQFITNLQIYGTDQKVIENFIKNMGDNNNKNINEQDALEIKNKIMNCVQNMIIMKCSKVSPTDSNKALQILGELSAKIKKYNSPDLDKINDELNRKERVYLHQNNLVITEIIPEYLSEEEYKKVGIDIADVKKMKNNSVAELNRRIKSELDSNNSGGSTKEKPFQKVLTSGSGFADTLVLLSVMTTEIMIGLLIAFTIARG